MTTRRWPARRGRGFAGFSMIEVLAGMSFLSISVLGLTSLSVMTIKATTGARHTSAATNLARTKVEELRAAPFASLADGADVQSLAEDGTGEGPGAIYERSWTVSPGPTATMKQVTVWVAWNDGTAREISLTTAVAE